MKMPLKIANVCVASSLSLAIPLWLMQLQLSCIEMPQFTAKWLSSISAYVVRACVCVCVYRCYSIFLRVYWRNNFQPRLDLLFQFSLELALLFMYLTFYCVMCSNCHQNVHKLRKYVCEWGRRWRGGEGSFANCRVRVQYLPALNRRCINIMCQHKKHSGHAQTQRWHTYTHTHIQIQTHKNVHVTHVSTG